MNKLQSMQVLLEVVDAGNFSAAARRLGLSAVMVGKHVRQLEELLGMRLLERSTRSQRLTQAGKVYCETARGVLNQIKLAENTIESMHANPRGMIRISAPHSVGATWIAPLVTRYLRLYPAVKIELILSNAYVNLIDDQFDLVVRVGTLADSELVARRLPPYQMVICGAPDYLLQRGTPQVPRDLERHSCLGHLSVYGCIQWPLHNADGYCWTGDGCFASNDSHALRQAALGGAGLILQPELSVINDLSTGRLVEVLRDHRPTPLQVHLLYLPARKEHKGFSNLVDFILALTHRTGKYD